MTPLTVAGMREATVGRQPSAAKPRSYNSMIEPLFGGFTTFAVSKILRCIVYGVNKRLVEFRRAIDQLHFPACGACGIGLAQQYPSESMTADALVFLLLRPIILTKLFRLSTRASLDPPLLTSWTGTFTARYPWTWTLILSSSTLG